MTSLTSQFANELFTLVTERESFSNSLIEIRQMLGITDNEVWTQDVLREKLERLAELEGQQPEPELALVED